MQALERVLSSNSWVTLSFLLCFLLIAVLKLIKPNKIISYSISFLKKGVFETLIKKKPKLISPFHITIFSFSLIVLSLFITMASEFWGKATRFTDFLIIISFLSLYLIFKNLIDVFIVKIFNLEKITRYFLTTKTGYLYTLSIWLFPILIINFYSVKNSLFLIIGFGVLVLLRFCLIVFNNKNLIVSKLFYFILYLCALEIAPLLILYKLNN